MYILIIVLFRQTHIYNLGMIKLNFCGALAIMLRFSIIDRVKHKVLMQFFKNCF
jgi:hypothetical protein